MQIDVLMNYIDRSRVEADWTCNQRRYWNTEYTAPGADRRGIVKVEDATALILGTAIHNALAGTTLGTNTPEELEAILTSELLSKLSYLTPDKQTEFILLARGWFWGFNYHILPTITEHYTIEAIEQEVGFNLDTNTRFMCRPDLLLKRRSDGTYWYPDFKSTGFKTKQWMDSWQYAIQIHSGCHALEESLDIEVEGGIIIGLYKGYYDKEGRLRSPFTYGYYYDKTGAWQYEYVRGWEAMRLDGLPCGLRQWVRDLPTELVKDQFPVVENIMFNRELLAEWKIQQGIRENYIRIFHSSALKLQAELMPYTFPKNYKACTPAFGPACPYVDACHTPSVNADPVGSRLYVVRQPHHSPEEMAYADGEIIV